MKQSLSKNQNVIFLPGILLLLAVLSCSKSHSVPPILVLANSTGYGTYTGEILKAEGFNEFQFDSLSDRKITPGYLHQFDIVILGETAIEQPFKDLLTDFVKSGGNLIAFRPNKQLAGLFGIIYSNETLSDGYIKLDQNSEQSRSLSSTMMQFHGTADKYILSGGLAIATLFNDKGSLTGFPGVILNSFGKGHTVAFSYNLPKSIVYTRQGNPSFAGIEKDGITGLRGMDMFTDGWLDTSNSKINQADEQMALLSHCIEKLNGSIKPLPRFWYFPDTLKCLVTLTNDGEYKTETEFEPQFRDVDSMGAKMSIYIIGVDKVSKTWVDKWTSKGFEIAGHPDDTKEANNPTWNRMDSVIIARKKDIASHYGLPMLTNVNHWFVWCGKDADGKQDFGAEAKLEEKNGIELDINYAGYDMKSNQVEHFLGSLGTNEGNFTGSGLVMKFADSKGQVINIYQHLNAVYDQEYNESHDPEGFYNCFKGLMDRSLQNEVYSFISVKSHNDEYYFSKAPLMKMLAYAKSNDIPVWTELKLLGFIKMRDEASFAEIRWSNNALSFKLKSSLRHSSGLTFILPYIYSNKNITGITENGEKTRFIVRKVKGSEYAFVTIIPGKTYEIVAHYR